MELHRAEFLEEPGDAFAAFAALEPGHTGLLGAVIRPTVPHHIGRHLGEDGGDVAALKRFVHRLDGFAVISHDRTPFLKDAVLWRRCGTRTSCAAVNQLAHCPTRTSANAIRTPFRS